MVGYEFKPFLHIERLDKIEVNGILNGKCWITAKVDGTNASVWADADGDMHYGSRKREINLLDDNAGFVAWMQMNEGQQNRICRLCQDNPNLILFGEWGVGKVGAIKKYQHSINKLWIFDIFNRDEDRYLTWEEIKDILIIYALDQYMVELLAVLENPTFDQIVEIANNNKFLLKDTDIIGEGVVIRNFNYVNPYGRYAVAKYVREDFRPNTLKMKKEIKTGEIEQMFVDRYLTVAELEKAKAKTALATNIDFDNDPRNGKFIGMFLNLLWNDILEENIVDFCKRAKNPQINFAALNDLIKQKGRQFLGLI